MPDPKSGAKLTYLDSLTSLHSTVQRSRLQHWFGTSTTAYRVYRMPAAQPTGRHNKLVKAMVLDNWPPSQFLAVKLSSTFTKPVAVSANQWHQNSLCIDISRCGCFPHWPETSQTCLSHTTMTPSCCSGGCFPHWPETSQTCLSHTAMTPSCCSGLGHCNN